MTEEASQTSWSDEEFLSALQEGLAMLGLKADDSTLNPCIQFSHLLLEANRAQNLTRLTTPREVAIKHFADSLSVLPLIPRGTVSLADVGSGAGFPGMALAIFAPELEVTLVDATAKKVRFLEESARVLELKNVQTLTGRSEDLARDPKWRESFDCAVWRGLGSLKLSAEVCMPLVKPGGLGIAMKGPKLAEELAEAKALIGQLGASVGRQIPVSLPDGLHHCLLPLRKTGPTPPGFPRDWAKIKKA